MSDMIATAGFYDGKFRKAGQRHSGPGSDDVGTAVDEERAVDLDGLTKDELIAEADRRGIAVKSSDTKAEILAALKG